MVNLRVDLLELQDEVVVTEDTVVFLGQSIPRIEIFLGQRFQCLHQIFVSVLFMQQQPLQGHLRQLRGQDNERNRS